MTYTKASFDRAVKQHVRAQDWTFLAVCTPGFEDALVEELQALGHVPNDRFQGGVEWTCRLQDAPLVLFSLRTANRVYVRIARFRAGAMEELFRKTSDINWEWWLAPNTAITVKSQVEYSRLSHEGECSARVEKAIAKRLESLGLDANWYRGVVSPSALILARVVENHVCLSLDVSGDLHYRRGYRLAQAKAPLRESLAASVLLQSFPGQDWEQTQVHDGMCGGGTFVIEALGLISKGLAGAMRRFAFEDWPALSPETLAHVRRKALEGTRSKAGFQVSGSDSDGDVVAKARICAEFAAKSWNCQVPRIDCGDFFELPIPSSHQGAHTRILCLNPPYGIRLDADLSRLYGQIARHTLAAWKGWQVLCIVPFKELIQFFPPQARVLDFRHGGLRVWAVVYQA